MLDKSEIDKLLSEVDAIKTEIRNKKHELNKLNSQKEAWFKKKKEVSARIALKINQLRSSKSKVVNITKEVKTLKGEKGVFSDEIRKVSDGIRKLKQDYRDACDKHGIKDNPSETKKKIDKLEFTLETSALGFEQEKRLNKEIKRLKKIYSQISEVAKIWDVVREKEKQISALKNQRNGTQSKLNTDSSQRHDLSEGFISNSQEVMDMKKQEDEYYANFLKLKDEFKKKNDDLKDLLNKKGDMLNTLQDNNVVLKEQAIKAEKEFMKEKSAEVKEKIKKKEKLTTEDLLVFQRAQ